VRRNVRIVAVALAGAAAAGFALATFPGGAGGQGGGTVTLQIAPRGLGVVVADPPGRRGDDRLVSECDLNVAQQSCELRYPRGTTVTLTPRPDTATGRSFTGWSTPDCPGRATCKVVLEDELTSIVGLFTPLRLAVRLRDPEDGTVSTDPAGADCRAPLHDQTPTLCREFPVRTRVTVTVRANPPHRLTSWSPGCVQLGPASCTVTVLDEATWIGASFDGRPLPTLPTTIRVQFRLRKRGEGNGRVEGSKLDCGSQCGARYDYGTSLTLTAVPDGSSVFEGWNGVCAATNKRCTVPVGPITAIAARFGQSLKAQLVAVHVRRFKGVRTVVVSLRLNRQAKVRVSLVARRRVAVRRDYRTGRGTSALRLRVPSKLAGGRYRLRVSAMAGGRTMTLARVVRLPRRR
jgi:List-Bact-rpt repeat protein